MINNTEKQIITLQNGFTMIEMLIVMAIFSIGILGAMSMQISSVNVNAGTRKSTLAMEYATDTMELLMQIGNVAQDNKFGIDDDGDGTSADDTGDELQLSDGRDNDGDGTIDEADEEEWHQLAEFQPGTNYTRGTNIPVDDYYASIFNLSWDISDIDCDSDGTADAKRIDMTVTWNDGNMSIQLTNIRANML